MQQMMAAVTHRIREMSLEKRPEPKPGEGEVLIKVRHVGICGSDLHFYQHGFERENLFPKILGHECAGEVTAFGAFPQGGQPLDGRGNPLAIGDRVALEPGVPCGECEWCRRGEYNLCEKLRW